VIAEQLSRHGLDQALFNMPPGDWASGERGIGALPGREQEFRDGVETAHRLLTSIFSLVTTAILWRALGGMVRSGAGGALGRLAAILRGRNRG
jgi:hypothetical protein